MKNDIISKAMNIKESKYFDFAVEILFLALVFLAPTIFDRRVGITFSLTKTTTIRILTSLILGVWALKLVIFKEHKWFRTALDWPVLTYMLCCTIAAITSVHVYTSLVGFYGRFIGLLTIYNYGLLFFITTNYIRSRKQIERILALVIIIGTIMGIYSIIQRYGIDPYAWGGVVTWHRVIATIGQPNFLAAYVDMAFILGLALLLLPKEKKEIYSGDLMPIVGYILPLIGFLSMIYRLEGVVHSVFGSQLGNSVFGWFWFLGWGIISASAFYFAFTFKRLSILVLDCLLIVGLTLMWISIIFTQSRGGLLGLFAGGTLFLLLVDRNILFQNWKRLLALFLSVIAITGFIIVSTPELSPFRRFTEEVKGRIEEVGELKKEEAVSTQYSAAGSRIETWKSAFRMISERPFFGVGQEVMKMVFPRYETELFRFKEAFHVKQDRCHNEVFDVAVTRGMITLLVYVWLLGSMFWIGWRKLKKEDSTGKLIIAGLLSASAVYFLQNQFSFGVVAITSLLWIMMGVLAIEESEPKAKR